MPTLQEPRSIHLSILIVVEKDGKCFHGFAPALKGLHVDGKSVAETLRRADDAVQSYLDSLERTGDPLPVGPYLKVRYRARQRQILRTVNVRWPSLQMSGTR